jgi:steroid delta-isomerase-like uncharacterized protein
MPVTATRKTAAVEAAQSFFTAYNAHQVDKMVSELSEDARLRYVPMGSEGEGQARKLGKTIWSGIIDAFPDLHVTVESLFGDEQHATAEVVIGGTQRKDFMQIPSQGKHYELPHAFLLEINDRGQISAITAYWDNASFFAQLGKTTLQ